MFLSIRKVYSFVSLEICIGSDTIIIPHKLIFLSKTNKMKYYEGSGPISMTNRLKLRFGWNSDGLCSVIRNIISFAQVWIPQETSSWNYMQNKKIIILFKYKSCNQQKLTKPLSMVDLDEMYIYIEFLVWVSLIEQSLWTIEIFTSRFLYEKEDIIAEN